MSLIARTLAALFCALALLSACGSDPSPSPSGPRASAAPRPTGSPPATPAASVPASQEAAALPADVQDAYLRLADAYNAVATRQLAILDDRTSTSVDRAEAIHFWADAERAFGSGLQGLAVGAELLVARDALREASANVESALRAMDDGSDLDPLMAALATAAERASLFRKAMVDWTGFSWAHEDAVKVLGAGQTVTAPGEVWVASGGWSVSNFRATYTAYVENPWDAYVFDVVIRVVFSPPDGPFGATQIGTVPAVGPGCRGAFTQSVEAPIGQAGIHEIRGEILQIGEWRTAVESAVGAR